MSEAAHTDRNEAPEIFTKVVKYLTAAEPKLAARYEYILDQPCVVVNVTFGLVAHFTTNGVQWCARIVRDNGGDAWRNIVENIGTGVTFLSNDAKEIGDGIIAKLSCYVEQRQREWRVSGFKQSIAERINTLEPTLEATWHAPSPGIYGVLVRLTNNRAAVFGDVDISWGYDLLELIDGCWCYADDGETLPAFTGAPEINYDNEIEPDVVEQVAQAILAVCREYRATHSEPAGAFKEYFLLRETVVNPEPDGVPKGDWRACELIEEGRRFVLRRERGEQPRLYPVGGYSHQGITPQAELFKALMPHLSVSSPMLREILIEEQADPIAILEVLVSAGVSTHDNIMQIMHELKAEGLETKGEV